MRLAIKIRKGEHGWKIESTVAGEATVTRAIPAGPADFPIPPTEELAAWAGCACNVLSADASSVKARRQRVLNGDTRDDALQILGGYLRGILLGPVWDQVEASAKPSESIEIEIDCDATDTIMNRLP